MLGSRFRDWGFLGLGLEGWVRVLSGLTFGFSGSVFDFELRALKP